MKKKTASFPKIKGKVILNEPLFRHTTFRIGGPCRVWSEPSDGEDLKKILRFSASEKEKIFMIGMGSNVLFRERGFDGILIHLAAKFFKNIKFSGTKATAGAGVPLSHLINLACQKGLSGLEGLVGIPGTLGGAIFMNSSYEGSISDCIDTVKVMDRNNGNTHIIKREDIKFSYRNSGNLGDFVILEAALDLKKASPIKLLKKKKELLNAKMAKQPLGSASAGCVFRNPAKRLPAAKYIEKAHLKGITVGDAKISEKHANFIVNLRNASGNDVMRLIEIVKNRVRAQFDVELKPEIIIV